MSGIVAVAGKAAQSADLKRMLMAAPHRGDRLEFLIGSKAAVGLQTFDGEDPFVAPALLNAGGILIAFSGCLYRYDSILPAKEAIKSFAHEYLVNGPAGLARLSGSFAAVLIDPQGRRCVAIRTPPGERPLFYRRIGTVSMLASEPKQLVTEFPALPDLDSLLDLVSYRLEKMERTPFKGVRRVLPGVVLTWSPEGRRAERFWDPGGIVGTAKISFGDAVSEFRRLLSLAVGRRLRRGAAVLMSGGLDSSAVTAVASHLHEFRYGTSLNVVSAKYPDHPDVDESIYVIEAAQAFRLSVTWACPSPRPFADLDFGAWLYDGVDIGPMSSNFRQILQAARGAGFESVLDGHDGDAAFGVGSGALHELLRRGKLRTAARYLGYAKRRSDAGLAQVFRRNLIPTLVDFNPQLRIAYRRLRPKADVVPAWLTHDLAARLADDEVRKDWREAQVAICEKYIVMAMEHVERGALVEGVGVLHPLSDPELLNFLMSLPPEIRYHSGASKSLVREGIPEIPETIRARTKKTIFNSAAIAGAPVEEVLGEVKKSPQLLPGIDWRKLEERLEGDSLNFPERGLLGRVLSADRFLGAQ